MPLVSVVIHTMMRMEASVIRANQQMHHHRSRLMTTRFVPSTFQRLVKNKKEAAVRGSVTLPPFVAPRCSFINSFQEFPEKAARNSRTCKVCVWENRKSLTVNTTYCRTHKASLCNSRHPLVSGNTNQYCCNDASLTCSQKYHEYYLPLGLWNSDGNLCRGNAFRKKVTNALSLCRR